MKLTLLYLAAVFSVASCASRPLTEAEKEAACNGKDIARHVPGNGECLAFKAFGLQTAGDAPVLLIFLHGDVSRGGPASYMHYHAALSVRPGVVNVALVRPGYADAEGNVSTGDNNGRRDNYTEYNIDAIADAIDQLKNRFKAREVFLVGHSGGAAVAGVILGRHPKLASGAMLASCPCNLGEWWQENGWRGMSRSLSPHSFIAQIPAHTRVVAISGDKDTVVSPHISEKYVEMLVKKGIRAVYRQTPGAYHEFSGLAGSPAFSEAFALLVDDPARPGKK